MEGSLPDSSVHGIFQPRILQWVEPPGKPPDIHMRAFIEVKVPGVKSWDLAKIMVFPQTFLAPTRFSNVHTPLPCVAPVMGYVACCSLQGHKESGMTEWLNWTEHRLRLAQSQIWSTLSSLRMDQLGRKEVFWRFLGKKFPCSSEQTLGCDSDLLL